MKLIASRIIHASPERCFDLLRDIDVHTFTSRTIQGKAIAGKTTGHSELGDSTTWSAKFFGLRFALQVKVTEYDRPRRLVESLERGLLLEFGHVYTCESLSSNQTCLTDCFCFRSPIGIFDTLVLKAIMQRNLDRRLDDLKKLAETK
jgi:hypothetical protein